MIVTMKGRYRTREGDVVEILRDNVKNEDFPIVGIITFPDGSQEQNRWQADGKYNGYSDEHLLDLISIPTEVGHNPQCKGEIMRKMIEVIYDDLSSYVAGDVIDWGINDDVLYLHQATNPNKVTCIPIIAIRSYSVEDVPCPGIGGRGLPEVQLRG
jgi:hypothetical protein